MEASGNLKRAGAWLTHPVSVLSVVVLIVNDHILKQAYGTWWTGKLSDAAGLVFFPALLSLAIALVARRAAWPAVVIGSSAITALGFAWVKATSEGAAAASGLLSAVTGPGVILQDATDLLALPFVVLALVIAHRPAATASWKVAVVLPVAVLATAATTAPSNYAYGVATVQEVDGQAIAGLGDVWYEEESPFPWFASDPGAEFHKIPGEWNDAPPAAPRGTATACLRWDRTVCYRAYAGHLGVERSEDAGVTWSVDWSVTEAQRAALVQDYDLFDVDDGEPHPEAVATREVAIVGTPSGYYVYAANGVDGLAMRSPDGSWERIGAPSYPGGQDFDDGNPDWDQAPPLSPVTTVESLGDQYARMIVFALALIAGTAWLSSVFLLRPGTPRTAQNWWKVGLWAAAVAFAFLLASTVDVTHFMKEPMTTALPQLGGQMALSLLAATLLPIGMVLSNTGGGWAAAGVSVAIAALAAVVAPTLPLDFATQVAAGTVLAVLLVAASAAMFRGWPDQSPPAQRDPVPDESTLTPTNPDNYA